MEEKNCLLYPVTKKRLMTQGYRNYSDNELNDYKFGIRFAYALCGTIVLLGLILHNIPLLIIGATVAFFGTFLPRHPFDYLYNYAIRHVFHKPELPPRTAQGRFACGIATVWLSITIFLFYNNYATLGYIFGATLLISATLVSTADICIPSMIYNAIFERGQKKN